MALFCHLAVSCAPIMIRQQMPAADCERNSWMGLPQRMSHKTGMRCHRQLIVQVWPSSIGMATLACNWQRCRIQCRSELACSLLSAATIIGKDMQGFGIVSLTLTTAQKEARLKMCLPCMCAESITRI